MSLRVSLEKESRGACYNSLLVSRHSLLVALQLSVADSTKDHTSQSDVTRLLADQSFVSSILASVCLINPLNFAFYSFDVYALYSFASVFSMLLL